MKKDKNDEGTGIKFDYGKPPMWLLPRIPLIEIAKVLDFGAAKYKPHNWRGGMKWSRLASALLRHIFAWLEGEDADEETGLSHLSHAGCCLIFLLEYEARGLGEDDRFNPDEAESTTP